MKAFLAAVLLVGLSVSIAEARDENPPIPPSQCLPSGIRPENDSRLAKRGSEPPQKIGVLSYSPNRGGGFTFREGADIAFYALPYPPQTRDFDAMVLVGGNVKGAKVVFHVAQRVKIFAVGTEKLFPGAYFIYRCRPVETAQNGIFCREDTPIAQWDRDTPTGKFQLSIMDVDSQTRVKLKSIVPVLEQAPKPLPSRS